MNQGDEMSIAESLRKLFGLGPKEEFGVHTAKASESLWPAPQDTPANVVAIMPGEQNVTEIFETYYGPEEAPANWSLELARGIINYGRQRIYKRHIEGFYKAQPQFLQRP